MGQSSRNFPHLEITSGSVYRERLTGVTVENFERIAKNIKFSHLYMYRRSQCLHPEVKGQGRTYVRYRPFYSGYTAILSVQKFASVLEL